MLCMCKGTQSQENFLLSKLNNEFQHLLSNVKCSFPQVYSYASHAVSLPAVSSTPSRVHLNPSAVYLNSHTKQHTVLNTVQLTPSKQFPGVRKEQARAMTDDINIPNSSVMLKVLFNNKKLALDAVMEGLDGHFLKTVIIPYILRKHNNSLLEIGMDMVVNFSISQKSYQTVLRNKIGATLKDIFGYNIFPTTEDLFSKINNTKDILQNVVELQFSGPNYCGTIAGFVNVKKSLEWLLSKKVFDGLVNPERKQIVVYSYTDAFPWMQWSRFFSGESAIRLRVVNVSNTLSSIITVGSWLGPDDFEYVAFLGTSIYKQLTSLKVSVSEVRRLVLKFGV